MRDLPTDAEVFEEVCRERASRGAPRYVSEPAAREVMAAVRRILAAPSAHPVPIGAETSKTQSTPVSTPKDTVSQSDSPAAANAAGHAEPAGTAKRLRDLAAGKITGEIKQFEYTLAADRIQDLEGLLEQAQAARATAADAGGLAERAKEGVEQYRKGYRHGYAEGRAVLPDDSDRAPATSAAALSPADLYAALRNMHWNDGKLTVIHTKDLGLGVQTYSGDMLDTAIVRATTGGEA